MKEFLRERIRNERTGSVIGAVLAVAVPVIAAATLSFTGIKYIYPPPAETTFLLEFEEDAEPPKPIKKRGTQPRAEEVDKTKPIELIQKSESPYKTTAKNNLTPATKPDDFGDVDTPSTEPVEEALDPRASFPGMSKKDTSLTAPHAADEASQGYKAGQPTGNTEKGNTDGTPNAHLKGRSVKGGLAKPNTNVQQEGTVVVTIWVDQYGKVQKAQAGAAGTTITDKNVWAAARNAAMNSHFSESTEAPALQEGTITYIFKLK